MILLKNILGPLLSLAVLITSLGIPINYHFCQDRLIDIKLFRQPDSCNEMFVDQIHICHEKKYCPSQGQKNGCCHNDHELIKFKNLQNTFSHLELLKLFPIYILSFGSYCFPIERTSKSYFSLIHDPPFKKTDKVVDFHTFLI